MPSCNSGKLDWSFEQGRLVQSLDLIRNGLLNGHLFLLSGSCWRWSISRAFVVCAVVAEFATGASQTSASGVLFRVVSIDSDACCTKSAMYGSSYLDGSLNPCPYALQYATHAFLKTGYVFASALIASLGDTAMAPAVALATSSPA